MIVYYFSTIYIFLKLFAFLLLKVFPYNALFIKTSIIISEVYFIHYFVTKKEKQPTFEELVDSYKLKSNKDFIINWLVILSYITILVFGILLLRIYNQTTSIDLIDFLGKSVSIFLESSWINLILNGLILSLTFWLYIYLLRKLSKYFVFQITKRHLYYSDFVVAWKGWYNSGNHDYCGLVQDKRESPLYYYLFDGIISHIKDRILTIEMYILYNILNYEPYGNSPGKRPRDALYHKIDKVYDIIIIFIDSILVPVLRNIHYITLIFLILYDIEEEVHIISSMFACLPLVFLYDLNLKVSSFLWNRGFMQDTDIHNFLYKPYEVKTFSGIKAYIFHEQEDVLPEKYFRMLFEYYILKRYDGKSITELLEKELDLASVFFYDYISRNIHYEHLDVLERTIKRILENTR